MVRVKRVHDLGISMYRIVIGWMCREVSAHLVFDEMQMRAIRADNTMMASLVYGLLAKGRVRT